MNLANGEINKFFSCERDNYKYFIESFDAESTKGINNVWIIANQIKSKSIVLDVGCGYGNFGKILKEKECILYGIDINNEAIEYVNNNGYYKNAFVMDIADDKTITKFPLVDVIIMSDIVEHLSDPTKVLLNCSKLLKDNGFIFVSVPNIAHEDIILNLINGIFNYSDMGILDNTHQKFFTKNSFLQWISLINSSHFNIKFDCEYIGDTFYDSSYVKDTRKVFPELMNILESAQNCNSLQILFKLRKINLDTEAENLKALLEEKTDNIVSILGHALKGSTSIIKPIKLNYSERIWYDTILEDLKLQTKKSNEYINELEENLRVHANKLKEVNETIEKKDKYINELEENLRMHANRLKEENETINKKDKYINELEENLRMHSNKLKEENQIIEKEDNYIKELEENLINNTNKLKEAYETVGKRDEYVKKLEKNIKEYVNNILDKEEKLKLKDDYIKKIQDENSKEVDLFKEELTKLKKQINDIENSLSWKITKLLRIKH